MTDRIDPPDGPEACGRDDERLPCGRLLSAVWDAWERQADDPHTAGCAHCTATARELEELATAVRVLREETAQAPGGQDASALAQRVMDVVRVEPRPGRPLPLGEPDEDLWIMETVAARTLRTAAETVSGVLAGSCRLAPAPGAAPTAPTAPTAPVEVSVRLEVHAPARVPLTEMAEDVRRRVREAADRRLGLRVAAVDICVTDLVDAADEAAGAEEDANDA
ncbi:Asp23/Gls24 family envelope stress response protein [Streptomyces sp. NPDC046985]|uniref:Asp23/Gls24 family envelope stress response protein n=1 Tax=Streptomyces sp. NPDC046985 TaxID=3155377 RepID=UPI0033FC50E9